METRRLFLYSWNFYSKKTKIITIFSMLFLIAAVVPLLVALPTYISLGGIYLRTESIPELSMTDIIVTAVSYLIFLFIISEALVNINLIIKRKRIWKHTPTEIKNSMEKYTIKIFLITTIIQLILLASQLLLFDKPFRGVIYPVISIILYFLTFYIPPAIVIDDSPSMSAVIRSINLSIRKPQLVAVWAVVGFILVSIVKLLSDFISAEYGGYLSLLVNSLFVLPYLIILQTQMYMEKYPLAK